jgi:hypothetical protein
MKPFHYDGKEYGYVTEHDGVVYYRNDANPRDEIAVRGDFVWKCSIKAERAKWR